MYDDDENDAWLKETREKAAKFLGERQFSQEELDSIKRKHAENSTVLKKYPDSNGSEFALLNDKQEIVIEHNSNVDNQHSHGIRRYAPDDKEYAHMWKRHQFDNPQGTMHVIMKKLNEKSKEWFELGDEWI